MFPLRLLALSMEILESDTKLFGVLSIVSDKVMNTVFVPKSIVAATNLGNIIRDLAKGNVVVCA